MKGLKEATMLYRKGTQERIHGVHVDYIIVDADEVEDYLDDGWHLTPTEVKAAQVEGTAQENAQRVQLERAREDGARRAREEAQQRAFEAAIQRAREEGAREERERIEAETASRAVAEKAPTPLAKSSKSGGKPAADQE